MSDTAAEVSGLRGLSLSLRFVVVLVAALAFALQSYIAQTHIHDAWQSANGTVRQTTSDTHRQGKSPFDHSRADCPFCQAVIHLGAALASPTPLLTLPFAWVETTVLVFTARADSVFATHHWMSRAPPPH